MSAIAGAVSWIELDLPNAACTAMLEALVPFGGGTRAVRVFGNAVFGYLGSGGLPSEEYDNQPIDDSRKCMLVTDLRLTNRDELLDALHIEQRDASRMPDADLVLRFWGEWGDRTPTRLSGDFALAIWDADARALTLARSPAATRPLYYWIGGRMTAFASSPQALLRLEGVPKALNFDELVRRLGGAAYFGNRESLFTGIESVEPGTMVRIDEQKVRVTRFWDPAAITTVRRPPEEAATKLRYHLERSVRGCVRGLAPIATHLSGGRDSGAVTACAANILAAEDATVTAYTAAPRADFPKGTGRYAHDESDLAAELSAAYPNIHHVVSRSEPVQLCTLLDAASAVHSAPMGNPANMAYWMRLLVKARDDGTSILLSAENGNFSISLGGLGALADVAREEGLAGWWRIARALRKSAGLSWGTLLNQSFGHVVPRRMHRLIRSWLKGPHGHADYPLFAPALRTLVNRSHANRDTRPYVSYRDTVREIYRGMDNADQVGLALHDIELRDPTADRSLIEFCLSLPASQIVGSQGQRPIYDLAFADLVPAKVRESELKGFQGADWFEVYDPEEIRSGFRRYAQNRLVRQLIDFDQAGLLLDAWPTEKGYELPIYNLYANHLLVALALASWVDVNFPEERDADLPSPIILI